MLDEFLGLPTHPLLVHGAVVLVPLLALLTAVVAWRAAHWRRAGIPLSIANLVVLGLAFLTKESGEHLEHRLPPSDLIHEHAELGDVLPVFAGLLLLSSLALWWLGRRSATSSGETTTDPAGATAARTRAPGVAPAVRTGAALVVTLLAVATCWWTFRVGHSGAQSVWHDASAASSGQGAAQTDGD